MAELRKIHKLLQSKPTLEGAGVHLKRAFGFYEVPLFDPFLLLDYFGSDSPDDYTAGFPWHPHRGIETVTYMLHGSVEHGDSLGNSGIISSGEIQWMTAGSGIIHQEMPKKTEGRMRGLQLWVNLPAHSKMMNPRYQEIAAETIEELKLDAGVRVKLIAGELNGRSGPVKDIVCDPQYLDISVPAGKSYEHSIRRGHTAFAFVLDGKGIFDIDPKGSELVGEAQLVLFDDGDYVAVQAPSEDMRFLLISGKPIGEPVAWRGPIVMNTDEELMTAFEEYRGGTFIKKS